MKYSFFFLIALAFLFACQPDSAQQNAQHLALFQTGGSGNQELPAERVSPPRQDAGLVGDAVVKVQYSSPGIKNRIIWGGLVPYDAVWRTGANEATTIHLEKDVLVEGQPLAAGTYSLYTIPSQKEWTVIFNYLWDQWGTEYNEAHDALRVSVKPQRLSKSVENLEIEVEQAGIEIKWEKVLVPVGIEAAPQE